MDSETLNYYNNNATELSKRYNKVIPDYFKILLKYFKTGDKVLDIGCGSLRDVNILLENGVDAYGLEPSETMIKESIKNFPSLKVRVKGGHLPDNIPGYYKDIKWTGITLMAVLQHLNFNDLPSSFTELNSLLVDCGFLIISVPEKYPDITNERDVNNRLFNIIESEELYRIILKSGFNLLYESRDRDALDRNEVIWNTLVFQKI